jgi:hypothetical protein
MRRGGRVVPIPNLASRWRWDQLNSTDASLAGKPPPSLKYLLKGRLDELLNSNSVERRKMSLYWFLVCSTSGQNVIKIYVEIMFTSSQTYFPFVLRICNSAGVFVFYNLWAGLTLSCACCCLAFLSENTSFLMYACDSLVFVLHMH